MCGIVGFTGKKACRDILLAGLLKLEYRGYDSAGIAVTVDGAIHTTKAKGKIAEGLLPLLEKDQAGADSHTGIGHTRWATHGEPSDVNSHPIGNARVSIVHNGIIENYREIKKFLTDRGYAFETDTDTETVATLLDYYYDGDPVSAIIHTLIDIRGAYALGIIFRDFPERIFAVRKESPLIVANNDEGSFIASDVTAIIQHTKDYYPLEQNEIAVADKDGVKFIDVHRNPIDKPVNHAEWDAEAAQKGGFEHFMLKEIYEQPTALRSVISPRIKDGMPNFDEYGLTDERLKNYRQIFIVACGTACYAGIVGKYVIEQLARVPVTVDIASEFRYRNPLITKEDLVIFISQSGETLDTLAALKLANSVGADTLALVNVVGSSIAREAKMVIPTLAGPEISVASTKAYMVQCALMYLLAFRLAFVFGKVDEQQCKDLTAQLTQMPEIVKQSIETHDACSHIASRLITTESILYIGRGLDYALSMEGSLKFKELSYIHSESIASGELKHGTIALIHDGMPVIAIATQSDVYEKTASNVKEVKARGACVIMVYKKGLNIDLDSADYTVELPDAPDILMPLACVVPLQMIAYYTAVLKGCDVDKPRNLAKSVTVE
jgi:glucosamine--fructose-6-phosphate aminotransferase (isomerizing)